MSEYRQRSNSPSRRSSQSHKWRNKHKEHHILAHGRSHTRSRSPHSKRETHESDKHPRPLPRNSAPLFKRDLATHRALFALYLDVQKDLDIQDLEEPEVKGRWKSFMKKWNAGDLAEGWYHPETFEKAKRGTFGIKDPYNSKSSKTGDTAQARNRTASEDEEEEDFGPRLPSDIANTSSPGLQNSRAGPSIPSASDLHARSEQDREDADAAHNAYVQSIRSERKLDRQTQKERLDELVPRAEPGSRERQLEKKQEVAASNRAFAASKDTGGEVELRDADVMGDEDSLGELKRMKEFEQRKRTDREIRREEILRTRAAEREERVKGLREKEAKTMEMLKGIARARFGGNDEAG